MKNRELNNEGVGLGLTISKSLAKALGGDIYVQSQIGVGSSFTLKIPVIFVVERTNIIESIEEVHEET
jgi:signal transduction histidine kinase